MTIIRNFLLNSFWEKEYFNNTLWEYLTFLFLLIAFSFVFFSLKELVFQRASQRINKNGKLYLFLNFFEKIGFPFFIFLSFYFALSVLQIPENILKFFNFILITWIIYSFLIISFQVVDFFTEKYLKNHEKDERRAIVRNLGFFVKILLGFFAILVIFSTLNINITAIVAGMGIGGIAVAFALQNILSDLFSSFSIYFDRPFTEGDFIIVGDKMGTVEKIGIKSTRVRAIQGEEIIFSNKELTSVQVHNLAKLKKRRVDLKLNITHETETKKLEKIPQ
jgi:small-conductance mechanosensitive channel